ncbi:hypothetical protein ACFV2X_53020 [Streptomyces sp. NPDC059679]|uniref:hypothetical protein n=1 Tax=Streptomyces sp. NPDC059679 TaxID=3346903 RepID=UPI0036AB7683
MYRKQVLTAIVLVTALAWSVVMAALGHVAAIAALVPSLGSQFQLPTDRRLQGGCDP